MVVFNNPSLNQQVPTPILMVANKRVKQKKIFQIYLIKMFSQSMM